MLRRLFATALASSALACSACGGGPRSTGADLVAILQPTPDPTLDAVVRDLPRALAGIATATPMPRPTVVRKAAQATPGPTTRPTPRPAAATPTRTRR